MRITRQITLLAASPRLMSTSINTMNELSKYVTLPSLTYKELTHPDFLKSRGKRVYPT